MVVAAVVGLLLAGLGVAGGFWAAGRVHVSGGSPGPWVAAGGVVLAAAGVYGRSLRRHPWRPCQRCKGRGEHVDTTVWKGTSGKCLCCANSGQKGKHVRLPVRVFQPGRARELRAGQRGKFG
jgi:hypothetical protein